MQETATQQTQGDALRKAAEQFVAAHQDGMTAQLADYFAGIFKEALALPATE